MLPSKYRLKLKRDFERVFTMGTSCCGRALILKYQNNDLPQSRFGFVVSNKVSKKAVERNLLRRRLRAVIYKMLPEIFIHRDYVFIARAGILKLEYKDLKKEVEWILRQINHTKYVE